VGKEADAKPRFTFETKEYYEQVHNLCQKIPHWKSDAENPIHHYIPLSQKQYLSSSVDFADIRGDNKENPLWLSRDQRLLDLSKPRGQLALAGTMALRRR